MMAEAQMFWDSIVGKIKSLIRLETANTFRVERYEVTTAPNGTVIGVTKALGSKEIFLTYSQEVASASVGQPVLVVWWGSMSNAKVYYFANGYSGSSGGSIVDRVYPVGSIYMSVNSTSPETLFGGTWQQISDTFLLAAGSTYTAGSTGGEAEHTLIKAELPAENINIRYSTGASNYINWGGNHMGSSLGGISLGAASAYTLKTDPLGSGNAHNNMPPYLTVYMWQRTA